MSSSVLGYWEYFGSIEMERFNIYNGVCFMKKMFFIMTAFFIFSCSKNAVNNGVRLPIVFGENYCEIKLSYDVDEDVQYIFSPDTTVALDVKQIIADGNVLEMERDEAFNVSECPVRIVKDFSRDDCYVTLHLKGSYNGRYYLWNDGRGILFNKGENNVMYPYTNSYLIPRDAKWLKIRYRVLIPGVDINRVSPNNFKDEKTRYTKSYMANISFSDFTVTISEEDVEDSIKEH